MMTQQVKNQKLKRPKGFFLNLFKVNRLRETESFTVSNVKIIYLVLFYIHKLKKFRQNCFHRNFLFEVLKGINPSWLFLNHFS